LYKAVRELPLRETIMARLEEDLVNLKCVDLSQGDIPDVLAELKELIGNVVTVSELIQLHYHKHGAQEALTKRCLEKVRASSAAFRRIFEDFVKSNLDWTSAEFFKSMSELERRGFFKQESVQQETLYAAEVNTRSAEKPKKNFEVTCWRCGEKGHYKSDCPTLRSQFSNQRSKKSIDGKRYAKAMYAASSNVSSHAVFGPKDPSVYVVHQNWSRRKGKSDRKKNLDAGTSASNVSRDHFKDEVILDTGAGASSCSPTERGIDQRTIVRLESDACLRGLGNNKVPITQFGTQYFEVQSPHSTNVFRHDTFVAPSTNKTIMSNGACHHDGGIRSYTFLYNVKQKDMVVGMDAILADARRKFVTLRAMLNQEYGHPTLIVRFLTQPEIEVVAPKPVPLMPERVGLTKSEVFSTSTEVHSFSNLHNRLGHRSPSVMKEMCRELRIKWKKEWDRYLKEFVCASCVLGKMTAEKRLAPRPKPKAKWPLQRVYIDTLPYEDSLGRPFETRYPDEPTEPHPVMLRHWTPRSYGKEKTTIVCERPSHMLIIVDEASRYAWAYPIGDKFSRTIATVMEEWLDTYRPRVNERQSRHSKLNEYHFLEVRCFHTDGGSEFEAQFGLMCKRRGIDHVCSPPNQQWKNAIVEGRIRLIKDLTRTLMNEFCDSRMIQWAHFIEYAVSNINLLPTKMENEMKSPFERLFNHRPPNSWMQRYGTLAYVHEPREGYRAASRAKPLYFVGISDGPCSGYRLFNKHTRTVTVHQHCVFTYGHVYSDPLVQEIEERLVAEESRQGNLEEDYESDDEENENVDDENVDNENVDDVEDNQRLEEPAPEHDATFHTPPTTPTKSMEHIQGGSSNTNDQSTQEEEAIENEPTAEREVPILQEQDIAELPESVPEPTAHTVAETTTERTYNLRPRPRAVRKLAVEINSGGRFGIAEELISLFVSCHEKIGSKTGRKIRVLELCSGTSPVSRLVNELNLSHLFEVISVDTDPKRNPSILDDIKNWQIWSTKHDVKEIDIISATPDCRSHSMANNFATEDDLMMSRQNCECIFAIISHLKPSFWWIENPASGPRALHKMEWMQHLKNQRYETTYCSYGFPYKKLTSIWTSSPIDNLPHCDTTPCLAKQTTGQHWKTAQAGPSNGIPGTPRDTSMMNPLPLVARLLSEACKVLKNDTKGRIYELSHGVQRIGDEVVTHTKRTIDDATPEEICAAKEKEWNNLVMKGCFTISQDSIDPKRLLRYTWVKTVKDTGEVKARLCICGNRQKEEETFWETSSPTPRVSTTRILYAKCASKDWIIAAVDVKQAYINAPIGGNKNSTDDTVIAMRIPKEMEARYPKNSIAVVNQALYGAKQSGRQWWLYLSSILEIIGYTRSNKDPCMFMKVVDNKLMNALECYVDDIQYIGSPDGFKTFCEDISKYVEITIQEPCQKWNGLEIFQDSGDIIVSQVEAVRLLVEKHVDDLNRYFPKWKSKSCEHPESRDLDSFDPRKITSDPDVVLTKKYQSLVGALNYLAVSTRFDISNAVSRAARLMHSPSTENYIGALRILRYLSHHDDLKLVYSKGKHVQVNNNSLPVFAFVDASFASEPFCTNSDNTRGMRSTTGIVICASGGPIFWNSTLQKVVANSSGHAEIVAAHSCLMELMFIKDVLRELDMDLKLIPFFTDSTNCISFIRKNSVNSTGVRHLDVKLSQLYQEFCKNTFYPVKIHTDKNPADLLTKPFMKNYQIMREHIGRISGVNQDFETGVLDALVSGFKESQPGMETVITLDDLVESCKLKATPQRRPRDSCVATASA
jgi:transposase InsO family protein